MGAHVQMFNAPSGEGRSHVGWVRDSFRVISWTRWQFFIDWEIRRLSQRSPCGDSSRGTKAATLLPEKKHVAGYSLLSLTTLIRWLIRGKTFSVCPRLSRIWNLFARPTHMLGHSGKRFNDSGLAL